jgi:hypothetical protein
MKLKTETSDNDESIEAIKAKQRNTVWPDTMVNSRGVDAFLWRGDPDAPLVQRIGTCVFGLIFILIGLGWVDAAFEKHDLVFGVLSIAWFLIGGKVFLNGFRKRRTKRSIKN